MARPIFHTTAREMIAEQKANNEPQVADIEITPAAPPAAKKKSPPRKRK